MFGDPTQPQSPPAAESQAAGRSILEEHERLCGGARANRDIEGQTNRVAATGGTRRNSVEQHQHDSSGEQQIEQDPC